MLFRKYLAVVQSTYPWTWLCLLTWWFDRLFVEFGSRSIENQICTHSEIQYVEIHKYMTVFATGMQIFYSVKQRREQFIREAHIMGIVKIPTTVPIFICETIITICWQIVIVCIIDVSPWLCIHNVLYHRATITLLAILLIVASIPLEGIIWDKQLQNALQWANGPMEI